MITSFDDAGLRHQINASGDRPNSAFREVYRSAHELSPSNPHFEQNRQDRQIQLTAGCLVGEIVTIFAIGGNFDLRFQMSVSPPGFSCESYRFFQMQPVQFQRSGKTSTESGQASALQKRRAVAAMETAVVLPLLVTLVFGAIEISNAVFLKQSLNMAAYEAAKVITAPGSNDTFARLRCQEVLNVRKVTSHTLTFSPNVTALTPRGTQVTITVEASASNLSYGPLRFMTGRTIRSSVVMVRL